MSINDEQNILIKKLQDENRLLQEQINLSISLHSASSEYPDTTSSSASTTIQVASAVSVSAVATDVDKNTPANNVSQSYTTDYADDSEHVYNNYTSSNIDDSVAMDSDNIACQQQSSLDINSLLPPHFGRDNNEETTTSDDDDINALSTIDHDSQLLDINQLLPLNFGMTDTDDTNNHVDTNIDTPTHSGIHYSSSNNTKRSRRR